MFFKRWLTESDTGIDPNTGLILDPAKYAAHQKSQRVPQRTIQSKSQQEVIEDYKGRLSKWLDMPRNQQRSVAEILQDPDYVRLTSSLATNVKQFIDRYIC